MLALVCKSYLGRKNRGERRKNVSYGIIARCIIILLFIGISTSFVAIAQPYYYFANYYDESSFAASIYRINLQNGLTEPFISDTLDVINLHWNPSQDWIFVLTNSDGIFCINTSDPTVRDTILQDPDIQEISGMCFVEQKNKFYISWPHDDLHDTIETDVYDATTFQRLSIITNKLVNNILSNGTAFISQDGNCIFGRSDEEYDSTYYLVTISTFNDSLISIKNFDNIWPPVYKIIDGANAGKCIIGYNYPGETISDGHYAMYDPIRDTMFVALQYPYRGDSYLSPKGDYIILKEVLLEDSLPPEYATGNIYVYESFTGKIVQHLHFPPEGKVLLFDNYPNQMFYYIDSTHQSFKIDLTTTTPIVELIDSLRYTLQNAQSNGWIADQNFVNELDSNLIRAKKYFSDNDSSHCIGELRSFRDSIDEEYKDSTDGDTKLVNIEAWKLLYFNAQYIVDRLSTTKINTTREDSISTFTITTTTEGAGKIVSGTPPLTFNLERPNPAIESASQTFTAKENESLYLLVLPAEGYDIDTVATDGVRYTAFLRPKGGAGLQPLERYFNSPDMCE